MKNLTKVVVLLCMVLCFQNCALDENDVLRQTTVEGTILDTANKPVSNVVVELITLTGSRTTQTDETGKYLFKDIPTGLGIINFSFGDYYPVSRNISIGKEDKTVVDITLRCFLDDYYMEVRSKGINLRNIDTRASFIVVSNAGFTAESDSPWLNVQMELAPGSATVVLTCEPNNAEEIREAIVTITGDYGKEEKVPVIQQPGPILEVTSKDNSGYLLKANRDGLIFQFTRPVEVMNIRLRKIDITKTIKTELLNNNQTVKLSGFNQDLFDEATYTLTVKASDGVEINTDFALWAYLNVLEMDYKGHSFIFNNDDKVFWDKDHHRVYTCPEAKLAGEIAEKYLYETINYSFATNRMIGIRTKPNGNKYVNYYDGYTGKFLEEVPWEKGKDYGTGQKPTYNYQNSYSYTGKYYILENPENISNKKARYYIFEAEAIQSLIQQDHESN